MKDKGIKILCVWHAGMIPAYRKRLRFLSQRGFNLFLIVPSNWKGEAEPQVDLQEIFPVKSLNTTFAGRPSKHFYISCFSIIGHLITLRPKILYIIEEPFSIAAFQWTLLSRLFSPSTKIVIETLENIKRAYTPPLGIIQHYVLNKISVVLTFSREMREVLLWKGVPSSKIRLFNYWGVDFNVFLPAPKPEKLDFFVVGFVGRIIKEKGIELLINAISKIDTVNIRLLIIGTGDYEQIIRKQVVEKGMIEKVDFIGSLPQESLANYYRQMDLLVLPSYTTSMWKEQFGRVLIEAMSCGIPVIGSNSGHIPEIIGEAGLLFEEGNEIDLRNKIIELLRNKELRNKLIQKGLTRVKNSFSWETVITQLTTIFTEVASG